MMASAPNEVTLHGADGAPRTVPLQRALLGALVVALLAGLVPAAVALDRRLARSLTARARGDLALAPRVVAARVAARNDALMMHAQELARDAGLAHSLARDDWHAADRALGDALLRTPSAGAPPLVVRDAGRSGSPLGWWSAAADTLLLRTRRGELPVAVVAGPDGASLRTLALAPVTDAGRWVGAAGYVVPLDSTEAMTLAALTRSEIVILAAGPSGPRAVASTLTPGTTDMLRRGLGDATADTSGDVREVRAGGRRYFVVVGRMSPVASVVFARDADRELAVLAELRRGELLGAVAALAGTLFAGTLVAGRLARPVRTLASAADATARGDFAAPLPRSRVAEVHRVSSAFAGMRTSLVARLRELETTNAALADRSARLAALQTELIQRDRLAAAGRLVAQLAHEIRNPVASLRNCLELLRRAVRDDPEAREFADLAIDELLRMHELAERMLDVHRPAPTAGATALCHDVARDVAALGNLGEGSRILVRADDDAATLRAAIPADTLKQVLLNLVENAREATSAASSAADGQAAPPIEIVVERRDGAGRPQLVIAVLDAGGGIPADVLPRIFDPFYTTKSRTRGVGLGLFVAEGLVRGAGGRITAGNRPAPGEALTAPRGAWFRVELPAAPNEMPNGAPADVPNGVTDGARRVEEASL